MDKKFIILLGIFGFLFCIAFASSVDFTPQGDINLRDTYSIKNAINLTIEDIVASGNITAAYFCNSTSCYDMAEMIAGTTYYAGENYITLNGSNYFILNETVLNATIDARDSDTTYSNGSGISLVGTQFNHSDTSSQASDDNSGNTFIQDILVDAYGHITSIVNAAVDFANYYLKTEVYNKTETYNRTEIDNNMSNYILTTSEGDLNVNASTWWAGVSGWVDDWLIQTGDDLDFNDSKLSTTYYNATQSQTVAGTVNAGTLADTQHQDAIYDGVTFNFTEVSGSPGLDLRINFTGISSFNQGVIRYKTSSLSGAYPLIQMWNYDSSAWEDYPAVGESASFATITQPVFDSSEHISGGVVQMRIYKSVNGNINNHYYVDWIAISKGYGTPSGEEVDPLAIHITELPLANRTTPYCGNITGGPDDDFCTDADTTIGNCSADQSCDNVLYETDYPMANKTSVYCGNITGGPDDDFCTDASGGSGDSLWVDQGDWLAPNATAAENVNITGNLSVGTGTNFLEIYADGSNVFFISLYNLLFNRSINVSTGMDVCITGGNCLSDADADTQLTQAQVEDYAGGMWTGNTESGVDVSYQTGDNTMDVTFDCSDVVGDGMNCDGENLVVDCSDLAGTHITCSDSNFNIDDDWYDSAGDIPNATPSDGDTTHYSTADQIYDWAVGLFQPISTHFDAHTTVNITCLDSACNWYSNATDSCMYWPSGGKDCGAA